MALLVMPAGITASRIVRMAGKRNEDANMIAESIRDVLLETCGTDIDDVHRKLKERIPTRRRDYLEIAENLS